MKRPTSGVRAHFLFFSVKWNIWIMLLAESSTSRALWHMKPTVILKMEKDAILEAFRRGSEEGKSSIYWQYNGLCGLRGLTIAGKKGGGSAQSKNSPFMSSQCGRPHSSEQATAEEAGLFLRLWDLYSLTASLRCVSLLQEKKTQNKIRSLLCNLLHSFPQAVKTQKRLKFKSSWWFSPFSSYHFCVHFWFDVSGEHQKSLWENKETHFQNCNRHLLHMQLERFRQLDQAQGSQGAVITRSFIFKEDINARYEHNFIIADKLLTFSTLMLDFALVSMNFIPYSSASWNKWEEKTWYTFTKSADMCTNYISTH